MSESAAGSIPVPVPIVTITEGKDPMRPDVDGELVLPVWEPTGDPAVDAALDRLNELDDLDTSEHVAIFEAVHRQLHQRLSDLNAGS